MEWVQASGLHHAGCLWGVGGAFGFELFFPAGEEPEDVGEAVEEAGDFGVGEGLFGAGEVDEGAFGPAGDGAGHVGVGAGEGAGGAWEGPAFEFEGVVGFEEGDFFIEPGDFGGGDGVGVGVGVALFETGRGGDFPHEVDEPALDLGADFGGLGAAGVDSEEAEGGVEFIDVSEGVDAGVFFGDAVAEEEIGFSLVTAAGGDRHSGRIRWVREGGTKKRRAFGLRRF